MGFQSCFGTFLIWILGSFSSWIFLWWSRSQILRSKGVKEGPKGSKKWQNSIFSGKIGKKSSFRQNFWADQKPHGPKKVGQKCNKKENVTPTKTLRTLVPRMDPKFYCIKCKSGFPYTVCTPSPHAHRCAKIEKFEAKHTFWLCRNWIFLVFCRYLENGKS